MILGISSPQDHHLRSETAISLSATVVFAMFKCSTQLAHDLGKAFDDVDRAANLPGHGVDSTMGM